MNKGEKLKKLEEKRKQKIREEIDTSKQINIVVELHSEITKSEALSRAKYFFNEYIIENNLSKEYIYKNKFKIFIFINQPEVSDLIIASLKLNGEEVSAEFRPCDDYEWSEYFYYYICPRN